MRYSGIQPQYFPRLHYFARILNTDTFVVRDDVQFVRKHKYPDGKNGKSYQAHSPIKHASGIHFLMVPVEHAGYQSINETKIQYNNSWPEIHLKTLINFYSKAPNFKVIFSEIEKIFQQQYSDLADLNLTTILWGLSHVLGNTKDNFSLETINTLLGKQKKFRLKKIMRGSQTSVASESKNKNLTANEKIINLLKEIGADEDYCGGTALAAYMDEELFKKNGIKITIQEWESREYPQLFLSHQPFIPNLSIIDLLMNVSPKDAITILQ